MRHEVEAPDLFAVRKEVYEAALHQVPLSLDNSCLYGKKYLGVTVWVISY
jgi:hypothetical protein